MNVISEMSQRMWVVVLVLFFSSLLPVLGLASPYRQDQGADGIVSIEVENFDSNISQGGHDWIFVAPIDSSGPGAMESSPNTQTNNDSGYEANSPRLDFEVNFTHTGTHFVWIRGIGATIGDDSVHVGLDETGQASADRITGFGMNWAWSSETMDSVVSSINVSTPGVHTVNVWMREDGFVIDKLLLTVNASFIPSGNGPAESPLASSLFFMPDTLSFSVDEGGSAPFQTIALDTSDSVVADYLISDDADWLTVTPAPGTTPTTSTVSVDATGLTPGTYTTTITAAADGYIDDIVDVTLTVSGDTSPYQQDLGADGIISIEVENFDSNISQGGHDWIFVAPIDSSGPGAMESSPNTQTNNNSGYEATSPRLDFEVNFTHTGTHYLWIRGIGATGNDDSVHVGLDGTGQASADRITGFGINSEWSSETMDSVVATINVSTTGVHTVNAWMREDGFMVDKLLLTVSASFIPSGNGPAESPRGSSLFFMPDTMSFNMDEGGSAPSQTIELDTSDGGVTDYLMISDDADWLAVTPASGTTPGTTTVSVDATGLTPGTYTATVTAIADGYIDDVVDVTLTVSGDTSPYQQDLGGDGIISIEVENFDSNISQGGHDWIFVAPIDSSGLGAMESSPNTQTNNDSGYEANSPRLDFEVNFTHTGTHYVWIRGIGATGNDDSVHVGLDGTGQASADRITGFGTNWTWSSETMDSVVASINVSTPGVHTVNVWMREDGFGIDKLLLTVSASFIPSGNGPTESPRGSSLSFMPDTLSFNVDEGGSAPSQTTDLDTSNGDVADYLISDDADWLTVTPASGATPGTSTVSVDTTSLTPDTYTATITATAVGYSDNTVNVTLTVSAVEEPFVDDFYDGGAEGWIPYDDSGQISDWQVTDYSYYQLNPFSKSTFTESYHLGKYTLLDNMSNLTDYRVSVEATPLDEYGNDIGLMFRYQDNDNYYRISFNSRYGFARLEKNVNGKFLPLRTNSKGYINGQMLNIAVEVYGSLILVYLNDDPLFSVIDSAISSGTVALYAQGEAKFDNVRIEDNSSQLLVVTSSPVAHSVVASRQGVIREMNGMVSIEAERYNDNISQGDQFWQETDPGSSSGDGAMQAFPNYGVNNDVEFVINSPRLDFKVAFIQAGIYHVWVRGMGASNGDDSVHVGLDGRAVASSDRITGFGSNWTWSNSTMDGSVATIEIPTDGFHTVNVWMREDGFVIDKLVLSREPNCSECIGIDPIANPANAIDTLQVFALATNVPSGQSVEFDLNNETCEASYEYAEGIFVAQCLKNTNPWEDDTLYAYLDGSAENLDTNEQIGIGGDNFTACGDSITNGTADNFQSDNISQNGKVLSIQGFESNLTDLLSLSTGYPTIVVNEGIPGDDSYDAAYRRIDSILLRNPNSSKVLILLGTNDSAGPVPSGWGCVDNECVGTYMENMQILIDKILGYGKQPVIAQITPAFGSSSTSSPYLDPMTGARNELIQQYNWVIAGDGVSPSMLTGHEIGPDFFNYFLGSGVNRSSLFSDHVHPNGLGMVVIANLWHNYFMGGDDFPFTIENLVPSTYKQNLLEKGDTYYIDSDIELQTIPVEVTGNDIVWISTANDDQNDASEDFITFDLGQNATVYIAYDPRATSIPVWLSSNFSSTGLFLGVTDPETATLELYSGDFSPGTITLGGNKAVGASFPQGVNGSNYIVLIKKF